MLFTVISPSPSIGRTSRRLIPIRVSVGLAVMAASVMAALAPQAAYAQYCGEDDCALGTIEVSAIDVIHYDQINPTTVIAVEPNTGEDWEITAYWGSTHGAPEQCDCDHTATAQVDVAVDWSDATNSWSATCTGCNAFVGPVFGVTICTTYGCGSGMSINNSWGYELVVSLNEKNGTTCNGAVDGFLSEVEYVTTSVDNGNQINGLLCSESTAVSPISQAFGTTDSGPFECTNSCGVASGPTVDIVYN